MPVVEEAAEVAVNEVANNLEGAAKVVRRFDPKLIPVLAGGILIGVGVGYFIGKRRGKESAKYEAFAKAEDDVEKIRHYYANREKPPLEEVIVEKGYEGETQAAVPPERPLPPPVPIVPEAESEDLQKIDPQAVMRKITRTYRTEEAEKDKNDGWSYPYELSQRDFSKPHIIHQDEFTTNETDYNQTTYMYYAGDDVLADTDGMVLINRENLIGRRALEKFGHGADDRNFVFVRNPELELEMEIIRVPGRYEVEVQGLDDHEDDDGSDTKTTGN